MIKRCFFFLTLFFFAALSVSATSTPAGHQLKKSIDDILGLLRDPQLNAAAMKSERRNRIFKVVEECFDFEEMSKRSLSEFWQQISDQEKRQFETAFSQLLETSYIAKVERYTNEDVNVTSEKPKGDDNILVTTEIISAGKSVPINYSMHSIQGRWRVYDVNIEGVSLVTNYRSQFREIMRKEGFNGLMVKMNQKIKNLE